MPDELLSRLDEFGDEHGYTGRSEVVREAARNLLTEFDDRTLANRPLMATVTVLFDFDAGDAEQSMMALRHEHEQLVTSHVHNHVGDHYCMELFVLEGDLEAISEFVGQVRSTRDTLSVDYSVTPLEGIDSAV